MANHHLEAKKLITPTKTFVTPDGAHHATWGAARRHLTHQALVEDVAKWTQKWLPRDGTTYVPDRAKELAEALVKDLTHAWNVSRRLGPKGRPRRMPR